MCFFFIFYNSFFTNNTIIIIIIIIIYNFRIYHVTELKSQIENITLLMIHTTVIIVHCIVYSTTCYYCSPCNKYIHYSQSVINALIVQRSASAIYR